MLKSHVVSDAVNVSEGEQALADEGVYRAHRGNGGGADGAGLAVGEVQGLAVRDDAAGLGELSVLERAVNYSLASVASVGTQVAGVEVQLP